jgi:hypothetical protein
MAIRAAFLNEWRPRVGGRLQAVPKHVGERAGDRITPD